MGRTASAHDSGAPMRVGDPDGMRGSGINSCQVFTPVNKSLPNKVTKHAEFLIDCTSIKAVGYG